MQRIGVFVCHCGTNIAATVDVERVAETLGHEPGVVFATHYPYMCSQTGQDMIREKIAEYALTGVVICSCSPRMHEQTFRKACEKAGLNGYMVEIANIREQCSWIHKDKEEATEKAVILGRAAIAKVQLNAPLTAGTSPVTKRALVIGGGIAGIQTALDIAEAGFEVDIVEKKPTIGGKMTQIDKTFPTLDCAACILTPKMVDCAQNEKIHIYAYSEVESVGGFVGNFHVKIRRKARFVDETKCTGCGACTEKCPQKKVPNEFNLGLDTRRAIYIPFAQAVPKVATIDADYCNMLKNGKCGVCAKVCPTGAINYEMKDEIVTETVGAIVAATGYDLMDWTVYGEYGAGQYPDVITSLQYERIMSASGPTGGHIKRPSDGKEPKSVVFIQCVGSRDKSIGRPYCSGFCCMYTAKQAVLTKDHIPDSQSYVFYMDIRSNAKLYDEFTRRAIEEYGTQYIRGRVSAIQPDGHGQYIVRGADTLLGKPVEVKADMVVLAVGIEGSKGANKLAETLHISYDSFGFFMESHCKLRPVETNTAGVFLAGVAQGPKDIPSSVAQGSGAAAKVIGLLSKPLLESDPQISVVDIKRCVGCGKCIKVCPFQAIVEKEIRGEKKAQTIEAVCQGCGLCTATCPQGAIQLSHFTDNQILAEVDALCRC